MINTFLRLLPTNYLSTVLITSAAMGLTALMREQLNIYMPKLPGKPPVAKMRKKSQLAKVKLLVKEVLFNNFRVVFGKETYSFGKIHVQNIEVDMDQVLEDAGDKMGALAGLYDLLMKPHISNLSTCHAPDSKI